MKFIKENLNALLTILFLVLIGILKNAMVLLGIDSVYQDLLQGLIAIIAVAIDTTCLGETSMQSTSSGEYRSTSPR